MGRIRSASTRSAASEATPPAHGKLAAGLVLAVSAVLALLPLGASAQMNGNGMDCGMMGGGMMWIGMIVGLLLVALLVLGVVALL